jgi:hypothetical protein
MEIVGTGNVTVHRPYQLSASRSRSTSSYQEAKSSCDYPSRLSRHRLQETRRHGGTQNPSKAESNLNHPPRSHEHHIYEAAAPRRCSRTRKPREVESYCEYPPRLHRHTFKKPLHHVVVPIPRSPVKRSHTLPILHVRVGAAFEKLLHHAIVAVPRSLVK